MNSLARSSPATAAPASNFDPARGALALLLHRLLVAREIHCQPALLGHERREIDRHAEGIVELERLVARDGLLARFLQRRGDQLELVDAPVERPAELLLLAADHRRDVGMADARLGICVAHDVDDGVRELVEERVVETELPSRPARPAEDAAEHVAAARVRRVSAVGDGERERPDVIGDDAERHALGRDAGNEPMSADLLDLAHDRREDVGVVIRCGILHDGEDALEPHAVSTCVSGRGESTPSAPRLYCMKTRVPDLHVAGVVDDVAP